MTQTSPAPLSSTYFHSLERPCQKRTQSSKSGFQVNHRLPSCLWRGHRGRDSILAKCQALEDYNHLLCICLHLDCFQSFGCCQRTSAKKDPCNFNTEMFVSKVGQLMSNSWSTSSQHFVHTLGRRKTARNRQGKILYTELLKSWPTLGQLLANSPPHGKLQGSSLQ